MPPVGVRVGADLDEEQIKSAEIRVDDYKDKRCI